MEATVPLRRRLAALRESEAAAAILLAGATAIQQGAAIVFTVVFTRVLGTDGYGALAALTNVTVILLVPGSALQVAVARQGTLGRLGGGPELAATLRRWTRRLLVLLAALTVVAVAGRAPLAALLNVDALWAAAAVPVTAGLWLVICVQRGLLQAQRAYGPVAVSLAVEGAGRIVTALALTALGLGVTGAYLGLGLAFALMALTLDRILRARLAAAPRRRPDATPGSADARPADAQTPAGPLDRPAGTAPTAAGPAERAGGARDPARLRTVARTAAVPIAALVLVAALQNVDVIMARRALAADVAGVYAAATVAAKFVVWIAFGVGLWVLPETTRRAAVGADPRGVLVRALAVIGCIALPALAAFALVPETILRLAFGADYVDGAGVLLALGAAFALLAATSVTVQFLLGLHRRRFAAGLLVVAVAEPFVLAGAADLDDFAVRVLALQAVAAAVVLVVAARARVDVAPGSTFP